MKEKTPENLITRRHFLGSIMFAAAGSAIFSSCKSHRWDIGCYTRPWSKFDYRVALDGIAGAGYRFAGIMTSDKGVMITPETTPDEAAEIGEEAKSRGLEIASVYGRNFDVSKSIEEGINGMNRLIDNVHACGSPNLILGGISSPELTEDYYKVIAECCDYASSRGVGITIKPHGGTNATGPECRMHIEKVSHPNFTLWYDPGNIYYYSEGALDPVDDATEVDGLVTGMCIKDYIPPRTVNITPGTGMVDFTEVFARLNHGGFKRGPLIVECLSPGEIDFINSEAVKAREFLENLTGQS